MECDITNIKMFLKEFYSIFPWKVNTGTDVKCIEDIRTVQHIHFFFFGSSGASSSQTVLRSTISLLLALISALFGTFGSSKVIPASKAKKCHFSKLGNSLRENQKGTDPAIIFTLSKLIYLHSSTCFSSVSIVQVTLEIRA